MSEVPLYTNILYVLNQPSLAQSVLKVIWKKSIPTQIYQLVLCISSSEEYVDWFVGQLTSAK